MFSKDFKPPLQPVPPPPPPSLLLSPWCPESQCGNRSWTLPSHLHQASHQPRGLCPASQLALQVASLRSKATVSALRTCQEPKKWTVFLSLVSYLLSLQPTLKASVKENFLEGKSDHIVSALQRSSAPGGDSSSNQNAHLQKSGQRRRTEAPRGGKRSSLNSAEREVHVDLTWVPPRRGPQQLPAAAAERPFTGQEGKGTRAGNTDSTASRPPLLLWPHLGVP